MATVYRLQNIKQAGRWTGVALVAGLMACTPAKQRPQVEIKGSQPATAQAPASQPAQQQQAQSRASEPSAPDASGVVSYDGYQTAVARQGDKVSDVAARVGLSASELGAYNGLQPNHVLRPGDELVLPQRPGGYGTGTQVAANTTSPQITADPPPASTATIEAQPLGSVGVNNDGTAPTTNDAASDVPDSEVPDSVPAADTPTATPVTSPPPPEQPSEWSPDLAAAAIERSQTGIQQDGSLGAPPSSDQPVPPEPTSRRELESPDLSQYQTPETKPEDTEQQAPAAPPQETEVAAADPAPTPQPQPATNGLRLRKPVQGPVAIGFNKGAGPQRNDGVDFAAAAGSPVVAAADGEVALVSQSLGGLGTIVLVRHRDEILTVYGRIDDVNVKKGDIVASGQKIGVVSNAAAPAEPRMHFEVRRGAESLDPMQFL